MNNVGTDVICSTDLNVAQHFTIISNVIVPNVFDAASVCGYDAMEEIKMTLGPSYSKAVINLTRWFNTVFEVVSKRNRLAPTKF